MRKHLLPFTVAVILLGASFACTEEYFKDPNREGLSSTGPVTPQPCGPGTTATDCPVGGGAFTAVKFTPTKKTPPSPTPTPAPTPQSIKGAFNDCKCESYCMDLEQYGLYGGIGAYDFVDGTTPTKPRLWSNLRSGQSIPTFSGQCGFSSTASTTNGVSTYKLSGSDPVTDITLCAIPTNIGQIEKTQADGNLAYPNACSTDCCGCYALNGPIPQVTRLTEFCSLNYGANLDGSIGPDGNTTTSWCLPELAGKINTSASSNASVPNPSCRNPCQIYAPKGSPVTGDPYCLTARFPLASNILKVPSSYDPNEQIIMLGAASATIPQTTLGQKDCKNSTFSPSYTRGPYNCPQNVTWMAQGDKLESLWELPDTYSDPSTPSNNAASVKSDKKTYVTQKLTVPCLDSDGKTQKTTDLTFYLNKAFISDNKDGQGAICDFTDTPNNSGKDATHYQLNYATYDGLQKSCEKGKKCDGTDTLPTCPAKKGDSLTDFNSVWYKTLLIKHQYDPSYAKCSSKK